MDFFKIKNVCALKDIIKKYKNNPQNGNKYLHTIDLIRDLYLECTKKFYNLILKGRPTWTMG